MTSGSTDDDLLDRLPAPIVKKLRTVVRRVRRVQLQRGLAATLVTAALAVLVIMLISACFTILSPAVHAALTASGIFAIAFSAYRWLFVPLRKTVSLTHIARVMETRHPELNERLSTAIGLLGNDSQSGSEELISKVVDGAVADAKSIRPKREFTYRSAHRYLITGAVAAVLFIAAFVIFPDKAKRLATRAIAPFSKVGNAFADRLDVTPGSLRIPIGDPVTIRVTISDADAERAEIRRSNEGRAEVVETMSLIDRDSEAGTSQFSITFPAVSKPFTYRIRSGRAVSESHEVTAVKRPEIKRLEVGYQFPSYTGLPPVTVTELRQTITAVTGTKIQIVANFDRALESAVLKIEGNPYPALNDTSSDAQNPRSAWGFEMVDGLDGAWELALVDTELIPSQTAKHPILAIPDLAPVVRLLPEKQTLRVKPDERVTLRYEVDEDFGLSAAKLEITGRNFDQTLPTLVSPGLYAGTAVIDVSELADDPTGLQTFEIYLAITDNRPEAQITKAGPITLTIDDGADSLADQLVTEQRKSLEAALTIAIEQLESARRIANEVPRQLLKPEVIPEQTLTQLGEVQKLTGQAEEIVRDSAEAAAAPSSLFKDLADGLNRIVDEHLAQARQAAGEIPLSDDQVTRVHRANQVKRQLDEGIADLNVTIRELKQRTAQARMLAKMSELGDRQQRLAEQLATSSSPEETSRLLEQQAQLASAMQQFAKSSGQSVADELQNARESAAELADIASQLSTEQEELTQMLNQAADPAQRNAAVRKMIKLLEREQRKIGQRAATIEAEGSLKNAVNNATSAADALEENRLTDAAKTAAINGNFLQEMAQIELAEAQKAIARQVDALARDRLDDALAARQSALAAQAEELAQNADRFRNRAESLADPAALQQVQRASSHANDAARAAHQASSQLGGDSSTGAFEFARSPDDYQPNQNTNPNAPSAPTQAGVEVKRPGDPGFQNDQLPDMRDLDGTRESPFSQGEVVATTPPPPPAFRDGEIRVGGSASPQEDTKRPSNPLTHSPGSTSGQDSIASAAQQPAMQAQHGLADASTALTNAAGNLAQQANSPGAQRPAEIDERVIEAARKAALAAIEKNPELAAKIAQAVATNLNEPTKPDRTPQQVKDWQNIRGKVKSGIAARQKNQTPEEYRDLVKSYFREIARRSNEATE